MLGKKTVKKSGEEGREKGDEGREKSGKEGGKEGHGRQEDRCEKDLLGGKGGQEEDREVVCRRPFGSVLFRRLKGGNYLVANPPMQDSRRNPIDLLMILFVSLRRFTPLEGRTSSNGVNCLFYPRFGL